jgi:poly(3-hydroxyalkanoate) synthetase
MYRYAYKVIANRIAEIQQRQFQILNYMDSNKEVIIELQKENMNSLMIALKQEKEELERILKENNLIKL